MRLYGVVVGAAFVAACAADPCGAQSPCPNDPRTTPAETAMCRSALEAHRASPCYAELLDLAVCAQENIACNASGTSDPSLTQTRQQNNCRPKISAFQVCCASNPSASACRP